MIRYRALEGRDLAFLEDFLYLAIHQPDPGQPVPRSIVHKPELSIYASNWGRAGDEGIVAISLPDLAPPAPGHSEIVGMAWSRVLSGDVPGYGNIDDRTPEISISVRPQHRDSGMGTQLLQRLIMRLTHQGWAQVSLSVQKSNPAHDLYRRLGFTVHTERADDWVMVLPLAPSQPDQPFA